MADQLGLTTVNKKDIDLFVVETDLTTMNFPGRKGGLNRQMTGQKIADETIQKGDIDALTEETDFDYSDDWLLGRTAIGTENVKIKPENIFGPKSFNLATLGTMALAANTYIISFVITNSSGGDITFSIGTSAGGTQIIDNEVASAGDTAVWVVNYYQAAAANIHLTLSAGSLLIRIIKAP